MPTETGSDAVPIPDYDANYYSSYSERGYLGNAQMIALAHHFGHNIVASLNPSTVIDVGCAFGYVVEALQARGVEAYGIDISEYAIANAPASVAESCSVGSILEPLGRTVDLVVCIEVIEHLPASDAPTAVANLCDASNLVLLSSTPDEFEEPTHLNVQPTEYWSALFARHGFLRRLDFDASFVSPWAVLYERRTEELPEVVRHYDRSVARQRTEIQRLRSALLTATERIHELEAAEHEPVDADADTDTEADRAAELVLELDALRHEVEGMDAELLSLRHDRLRMVDEVESSSRRLGSALGRVTELEAEIARLQALEGRYDAVVTSRSWRLIWMLAAPYRAARHGSR